MNRLTTTVLSIAMTMMGAAAAAQQPSAPVRKDLISIKLEQQLRKLEATEISMAPGQKAPKHLHPCTVVGHIVSGTVLFQLEGEPARTLTAGEAFYEPKNKTVLHFDNASTEKPLVFVAFYLKEGEGQNLQLLPE